MKLKKPKISAPESLDCEKANRFTRTFRIEVVTPIYGGGVVAGEPDAEMPIRASAIRGQLRFWWRLLNRSKYSTSTDLFREERKIWGGMSSTATGNSSLIKLRVSGVTKPNQQSCAKYPPRTDGSYQTYANFPYGPGYVLFPGQGKAPNRNGEYENEPKRIIVPPFSFELELSLWKADSNTNVELWKNDVLPALRWWASFGGIGARTRRGMGSVKVPELQPVSDEDLTKAKVKLAKQGTNHSSAKNAWEAAITRLRDFRQGAGIGRNHGSGRIPAGRSRWPEADSIRDITGCHFQSTAKTHAPAHPARIAFPRAVFGLPIITHFKDGPPNRARDEDKPRFDPEDTTLLPILENETTTRNRLASPLILKAMWTGKDYVPIALLLPHDHVYEMSLQLTGAVNRQFAPGEWWSEPARKAMVSGKTANPLHHRPPNQIRTGDVLDDFLRFFEGK